MAHTGFSVYLHSVEARMAPASFGAVIVIDAGRHCARDLDRVTDRQWAALGNRIRALLGASDRVVMTRGRTSANRRITKVKVSGGRSFQNIERTLFNIAERVLGWFPSTPQRSHEWYNEQRSDPFPIVKYYRDTHDLTD